MKELIGLRSDSPSWTHICEIKYELEKFNENVMCRKYSDIPIVICLCFRCLTDDSGWKSKARYFNEDKLLGMDIVNYYYQFMPLKKNWDAQRILLGETMFPFFKETIKKYQKKIDYLKLNGDAIIEDLQFWLLENKWLK